MKSVISIPGPVCRCSPRPATPSAADKVCKVEISGNDAMQFDKKEIAVAADCTQVEVTLKHSGKLPAQAHGPQLGAVEDRGRSRASPAMAWVPGFANDHIKKGDARVIAHTKVIGGGQTHQRQVPDFGAQEGRGVHLLLHLPGTLGAS